MGLLFKDAPKKPNKTPLKLQDAKANLTHFNTMCSNMGIDTQQQVEMIETLVNLHKLHGNTISPISFDYTIMICDSGEVIIETN